MSENGNIEMSLQRVKVYRLNDDGKWDDKGTGHVSVEYLESSNEVGIVVIGEDESETLLVHRIQSDDIYQRQEDTIISWTDSVIATDLALSFQETMGCAYIWDQINKVQYQMLPPAPVMDMSNGNAPNDEFETAMTAQDADDGDLSSMISDFFRENNMAANDGERNPPEKNSLPEPTLSNLPAIEKFVTETTHFDRDRVATIIVREQGYVGRLMDLFKECEDLDNREGLHHIYKIIRGLIMLNDGALFDLLFADDVMPHVIGALEYDPEAAVKHEYRKYLESDAKYKEAIPIPDPAVLAKVHQTYRIGFLKDVIFPRSLEDQTMSTLSSLVIFNNIEIVSGLHNNQKFMADFFSSLLKRDAQEASWKNAILFLKEFCTLHKHLPPAQRVNFLREMVSSGIFEIVTSVLQSSDSAVTQSGMDILMSTVATDPAKLRNFLSDQKDLTLFTVLVKKLLIHSDYSLHIQILDLFRTLLDTDSGAAEDKDRFLDIFYSKFMDQVMACLLQGCPEVPLGVPGDRPAEEDQVYQVPSDVLHNICELLSFCVVHHNYRIKYYVLTNNVVEKVLRLVRRREKFLKVSALRFLRTCIGSKDDFYCKHIVKNSLFDPVVQLFVLNKNRYNLIYSAVLEMTEFIRKENLKILIAHLVEKYWPVFEKVDKVDTFKNLKLKYDQGKEFVRYNESLPESSGAAERLKKQERDLDKDEENYFSENFEEGGNMSSDGIAVEDDIFGKHQSFSRTRTGLVDYDDDENDDDKNGGSAGSAKRTEDPSSVPTSARRSPTKRRKLELLSFPSTSADDGKGPLLSPTFELPPKKSCPDFDVGGKNSDNGNDWFVGLTDSFPGASTSRKFGTEKKLKIIVSKTAVKKPDEPGTSSGKEPANHSRGNGDGKRKASES